MKSFKDYNPIAIFLYYALAVIPAMFCSNPVIMSISMVCAVLFRLVKDGPAACKKMWFFLVFYLLFCPPTRCLRNCSI